MTHFGPRAAKTIIHVAICAFVGVACDNEAGEQPVADQPLSGTIGGEAWTADGVFARWVGQPRGRGDVLRVSAWTPTASCGAPSPAADARGVDVFFDTWPLPVGLVRSNDGISINLGDGATGSSISSIDQRVEVIAATADDGTIAIRNASALGEVEGRLSFTICPHVPSSTWQLTGVVGDLDLELLGSVQMVRLSDLDQTRIVASNHVFWCRDVFTTDMCPSPSTDAGPLRELTIALPGHATGTYTVAAVANPSAGEASVKYAKLNSDCVLDDAVHPLGVQGTEGTITVDAIDDTAFGDVSVTLDVTMADGSRLKGTVRAVSCL